MAALSRRRKMIGPTVFLSTMEGFITISAKAYTWLRSAASMPPAAALQLDDANSLILRCEAAQDAAEPRRGIPTARERSMPD